MDFKKNILELMEKNNLTYKDMYEKLNVTKQAFNSMINAKNPRIETLKTLKEIFNCTYEDLLK